MEKLPSFLLVALFLGWPARGFARDEGGCVATWSDAFEKSVAARDKAVGNLCAIQCAAYSKVYCGSQKGPSATDSQLRNRLRAYQSQQAILIPIADSVPLANVDPGLRKRAGSVIGAQSIDSEENVRKPILLKTQMEFMLRFTQLSLDLSSGKISESKKPALTCPDYKAVVEAEGVVLDAMQDMDDAFIQGEACLDTQVQQLTGSPPAH